ncbi:hypothetical protein DPMN_155563 [Dreissena polymorpha]|uniref:Uncharacterized protein n=1 Tax=Dreissena polymorpha TaxID=45954 RepID=A0A9D4FPN0_DREPO|nr:hypothetical protein DPMN_155563 [Dreissena polymorpha]
MLNAEFEKKFQSLQEEFEDVERLIPISNDPDVKESDGIEDDYLPTGSKVLIAMRAALWIPLGIVADLVFIPIDILSHVNDERKLKEFLEDRSPFIKKWWKESQNEFLKKKSIDKCVFANYATILMKHIVSVSIKADMVLLESILNDKREPSEIIEEFTDIKTIVQDHIASLRLFELQYLAIDSVNCVDSFD